MGGAPSSGDDTNVTNRELARARANRDRREMAQTGVQDPLEFTRLRENLQAEQLEKQAARGQIQVPVPTMGTVALNTIASKAALQQAGELRRGGEMILGPSGEYKGVVREGVYSGDPAFDPISGGPQEGDDSTPTQRADVTPEVTPEITPERIENDEPITTRYARRRTKRPGQAGTIMEGYGVFTRPPSKRAVT